jgi:magnesium chelatase subunit I
LDIPEAPFHEDPYAPLSQVARRWVADQPPHKVPIAWWPREQRYGERLAPGSKFADLIGEIDPAKLVAGTSMGVEESLHFGLIPKMHRGLFAINELPELDELIQVGLFNLLEERDIQIRGLPLRYDLDVLVLFSANPATYNRSGKVIPQLKDRIGSLIRTHYPKDRDLGIEIMEQEAAMDLGGSFPVLVPQFMKEICEEVTVQARKSKYVDHASGVSARLSISNYRTMIGSARHRSIVLNERPAVPRISDLGHLVTSSLGKIELDLMSGNQMSETQVLDAVLAEAIGKVFREYVTRHGLEELIDGFAQGIKVEVGDMVPAAQYRDRLEHIPSIWDKAFEVSAAVEPAVQASCVEFVLAGLHSLDKISRSTHFGGSTYQL